VDKKRNRGSKTFAVRVSHVSGQGERSRLLVSIRRRMQIPHPDSGWSDFSV
jgi:hypothetical protein